MNDYFYSLGMLVTGRGVEQQHLSAMDLLAAGIANEENGPTQPHPLIAKIFFNEAATGSKP